MTQIYGNSRKRIHPYLPGLINDFAKFFKLSPHQVITDKTIYPLISFAQPLDAAKVKVAMLKLTDDKALLCTSLTHSRFRSFYGLNFCPRCAELDVESFGFAYWHIGHQIPGMQACHQHQCLLNSIPMGDGNDDRKLILPPMHNLAAEDAWSAQVRYAKFASNLLELIKVRDINYSVGYRCLLKERALTYGEGGQLKIQVITSLIREYWRDLSYCDHNQAGVPFSLSSFNYLGRMLRVKTHAYCHPIKHILLGCWLTDNNAEHLLTCAMPTQPSTAAAPKRNDTTTDAQIIALLKCGKSLNAIQKLTGKSRSYSKRIARVNRIQHQTNALRFSNETNRRVLIKAMYGVHRNDIARELNVGVGFVEQVIAAEPNMSIWRKHLRVRRNVMEAYLKLREIVKSHPTWRRTEIRNLAQSEYFLLYNNDKSLLANVLPKPNKPKVYSKNWAAEDERLCHALLQLGDINNMSLTTLDRKVNGHGNLLRNRTKLPKVSTLLASSKIAKL
jgi:hypothetical protein